MKQLDWKNCGKKIGLVACVCAVMIVLSCGVLGFIISKELIGVDAGEKMAVGIVLFLVFVFSRATALKFQSKRMLVSTLTASAVLIELLLLKSIALGGGGVALRPIIVLALSSLVAGVIAGSKKSRRR